MAQTDVLIVGAGPTGLVLALWLTKQGLKVRIIDKSSGPGLTSRAMAVQARTLELYRQLNMADAVVAAGYKIPAMNMWARGERRAQLPLLDAGEGISPYPFVLSYPQDSHEQLLVEQLRAAGIEVARQTELLSFEDRNDHVIALIRHEDGRDETVEAAYLAGCDGARSTVRHQIGSGFEGGTYKHIFYVADVMARGVEPAGEGHVAFDKSDFALVLPYGQKDRYRLIGTVRDERATDVENLTFDDVSQEVINSLNIKTDKVNWFATYRVHHRVTDHFRRGRVFLLGDAAHVHSPVGGQGMNTGIFDAINLAWKLTAVIRGQAPDALLDSYQTERQAFAHRLVETTDRLFKFATAEGGFADFMRTRIAPIFASVAYKIGNVREYMFQMVSQVTLSYHNSPLSVGEAGSVQGGDRLPWVQTPAGDNYQPLSAIGWQVHVYGVTQPDLAAWCAANHIPLHVFAWLPEHGDAGLTQNATYLLRPDTFVALADPQASVDALARYFSDRGITPAI